jgi:hypothetical protein
MSNARGITYTGRLYYDMIDHAFHMRVHSGPGGSGLAHVRRLDRKKFLKIRTTMVTQHKASGFNIC